MKKWEPLLFQPGILDETEIKEFIGDCLRYAVPCNMNHNGRVVLVAQQGGSKIFISYEDVNETEQ